MEGRWKQLGLGAVVLLFLFGAITWLALESGGVAIVSTTAPDGSIRETHVWYVEPDGELWVEAGTPENPWYVDVQRDPRLDFRSEGRSGDHSAEILAGDFAHDRIRSLIRAKYGIRDWWVGWLVDTSGSVAVRLHPAGQ
jgi:hypothetical protein